MELRVTEKFTVLMAGMSLAVTAFALGRLTTLGGSAFVQEPEWPVASDVQAP
ncbi:MAG: hypothetical protein HY553_07800 [Elusimicrobia bacterium]|nr:hypothetical protein [Elusimicrobiota bacterium]